MAGRQEESQALKSNWVHLARVRAFLSKRRIILNCAKTAVQDGKAAPPSRDLCTNYRQQILRKAELCLAAPNVKQKGGKEEKEQAHIWRHQCGSTSQIPVKQS
eukprot:scaffold25576_cov20-Tisochrysis_lutea.AAC.1